MAVATASIQTIPGQSLYGSYGLYPNIIRIPNLGYYGGYFGPYFGHLIEVPSQILPGQVTETPQPGPNTGYVIVKPQPGQNTGAVTEKPLDDKKIEGYGTNKPVQNGNGNLGYLPPRNRVIGQLVSELPLIKNAQGYQFNYQVSDGQKREESAQIIPAQGYYYNDGYGNAKAADSILRVKGSYNYVDPVTGQVSTVYYEADENGYRASGDIIPK